MEDERAVSLEEPVSGRGDTSDVSSPRGQAEELSESCRVRQSHGLTPKVGSGSNEGPEVRHANESGDGEDVQVACHETTASDASVAVKEGRARGDEEASQSRSSTDFQDIIREHSGQDLRLNLPTEERRESTCVQSAPSSWRVAVHGPMSDRPKRPSTAGAQRDKATLLSTSLLPLNAAHLHPGQSELAMQEKPLPVMESKQRANAASRVKPKAARKEDEPLDWRKQRRLEKEKERQRKEAEEAAQRDREAKEKIDREERERQEQEEAEEAAFEAAIFDTYQAREQARRDVHRTVEVNVSFAAEDSSVVAGETVSGSILSSAGGGQAAGSGAHSDRLNLTAGLGPAAAGHGDRTATSDSEPLAAVSTVSQVGFGLLLWSLATGLFTELRT
jgi:hypothetical protein